MIMYCHMGKLNVFFKRLWTFVSFVWGDTFLKILLWAMSEILLPMFSSKIFMVSGLTFKALIHFGFILVCGVRRWSSFIFLHVSFQFPQHHFLDKLSLAHCMCLFPLLFLIVIQVQLSPFSPHHSPPPPFPCLITVDRFPVLCCIRVVKANTLDLFPILGREFLVFACWVWC